ncbi:hypothetical protein BD413DRAFT_180339 [Trametes elegans]|nr:hypothetical protein BD413DRAFT_180339 [Trametes elegans]
MANNDNGDTATGGGNRHQKLRGAAEVAHGIGENLRGRFMSTVDSSTNTGGTHPEVEKGRREVERGMAKLTGGPGVTGTVHGYDSGSTNPTGGDPPTAPEPPAQEGNVLGPTSGINAGLNAGPTTAVAEAPFQPQYAPSGAGPEGVASIGQGKNDRDFHPGSAGQQAQGGSPGSAPDHSSLPGDPQRLA